MFARLARLVHLRQSTGFLLARADDRLLDDIGLTRGSLQALHLGVDLSEAEARVARFHSLSRHRALPAG